MAGYIGSKAAVVSSGAERKKTFAITTTTTALTGLSYTPTLVHLFHNGVRLVDGTDYTATNGTSITLTTAAENGDEVVVISYATFQVADAYTKAEADSEFVSDPNGAVTVDGSGNVGIGTASPVNNSNRSTLALEGAWGGQLDIMVGSVVHAQFGSDNSRSGQSARIQSQDGIVFRTSGDNERMRIDSAGRVTTPYQPSWFASGVGGFITTSSGGVVPLAAVSHNVGNHYNTSGSKFTAPVSGTYQINLQAYIQSTSQIVLKKNGADYVPAGTDTQFLLSTNSSGAQSSSASGVVYLNANDYIQMGARINQSVYLYKGHTSFSGYLIG